LNVGPDDLPASWSTTMSLRLPDPHQHGQTVIRSAFRADHFAGIGHGIGVVLDSYGMYAVSLDRRSAADDLGLAPGDQVVLSAGSDDEPGGGPVTTPVNLGR
jgi:hypothetical protein